MIEIQNVTKSFGPDTAVENISATLGEGRIFGLIGSNGAGKSTLLRMMAGVLKPDAGEILIDGMSVYENPEAKRLICLLADTAYYFPNARPMDMAAYYRLQYPDFDMEKFRRYLQGFQLPNDRKISAFSKGQKRQIQILLGICAGTRYLICDETFDGLDPVARQAVKGILSGELLERGLTPVIASHNLRELEDICDCVGLIHQGRILFTGDLDSMKWNLSKIQCVIPDEAAEAALMKQLDILHWNRTGTLLTMTVRGEREAVMAAVNQTSPLFAEVLPLSLEEIFISETEAIGYDIQDFIA